MAGQLDKKVALVTGGGSGIGRASALALAREGAKVIIADVNVTEGEETVQLIQAAGGTAIFVQADVSQATEVAALVKKGVETYSRLDCALNNAGIQGEIRQTAECSEENWDRIIATNLTGVWLCMKHEISYMLKQGGGAIVNIASNFGLVGSRGMPAYTASKHGVVGLTKTAALEYAKSGIRVNAVCPGPTQTPLVDRILSQQPQIANQIVEAIKAREPMGRMGQPEEIADAVVWLCSEAASFVTGIALAVDGGFVAQ
ncbi:MAG: SDR family oxidoreductase [Nitrospinae bacterium]|nr:SDR family oxidoreductase [Nitrospinota bacterium]